MRTLVTILLAIILAVVAVLAFGVAVCASDAGHPWVWLFCCALSLISIISSVALLTGRTSTNK